MKTRTEKVIDVGDWDELVEKTYGRIYSFQQQDGCKERGREYITVPDSPEDYKNDTVIEKVNGSKMGVSFDAWLARDPKQKLDADNWDSPSAIDMWWGRNFYPHVSMVANDLHSRGLLEAGDYTIDIDW